MQTFSEPFIIAIDGPAGSGKTTTAKLLAKRLGFTYIDTGAMYRAVALAVRGRGIDFNDQEAICALLPEIRIEIRIDNGDQTTVLNGSNVEREIRSPEISKAASDVSKIACVREAMVELQRKAGRASRGAVLEGRDIGTVVFSDAPLKVYLTAEVGTRAERRAGQLRENGIEMPAELLKDQILERDRNDSTREHSPLRKVDDSVEIDTTRLSVEEQVDVIYELAIKRMKEGVPG